MFRMRFFHFGFTPISFNIVEMIFRAFVALNVVFTMAEFADAEHNTHKKLIIVLISMLDCLRILARKGKSRIVCCSAALRTNSMQAVKYSSDSCSPGVFYSDS